MNQAIPVRAVSKDGKVCDICNANLVLETSVSPNFLYCANFADEKHNPSAKKAKKDQEEMKLTEMKIKAEKILSYNAVSRVQEIHAEKVQDFKMTEEEFQDVNKTHRMEVAEFQSKGKWKLTNSFAMGGAWMVLNGVFQPNLEAGGWLYGYLSGKNFFYCGLCGTPISSHFTVEDEETGKEINIGSSCIGHVVGEERAASIKKGIESAKRQVENTYKRVLKTQTLVEWLKENVERFNDARNKRINNLLAADSDHYFKMQPTTKQIVDSVFYGNAHYKTVQIPEEIRRVDAQKTETRDRAYWTNMFDGLVNRNWNPDTMRTTFKKQLEADVQEEELPKNKKLSKTDQDKVNRAVNYQVQIFIQKLALKK